MIKSSGINVSINRHSSAEPALECFSRGLESSQGGNAVIFIYHARQYFNFMDYVDSFTISAIVTMIAAWIPACARMTKLRDSLAKKSNDAKVPA